MITLPWLFSTFTCLILPGFWQVANGVCNKTYISTFPQVKNFITTSNNNNGGGDACTDNAISIVNNSKYCNVDCNQGYNASGVLNCANNSFMLSGCTCKNLNLFSDLQKYFYYKFK